VVLTSLSAARIVVKNTLTPQTSQGARPKKSNIDGVSSMAVTLKRHYWHAIALIVLAIVVMPAHAGVIVTREFDSQTLGRKWAYTVYLPDGYESSSLRYPVLYLLHGNGQNLNSWSVQGRIQLTAGSSLQGRYRRR
jgi:S-formylglutathione hydrolase FrmB